MKQHLQHFFMVAAALLASAVTFAQSGLTIQEGTQLFISSGTTFSVDSLVLTPSADFTLSGANAVTRTGMATNAYPGTVVSRAYLFQNPIPSFSGTIGFYYRDEELNGLSENGLTLHLHNGTAWNTVAQNVTRDATGNLVTTTSLSDVVLNEITLADECPTKTTYYHDNDGDGYGNADASQQACTQPANYVTNSTDCNDDDRTKHATYSFYVDSDGDGYGSGDLVSACAVDAATPPAGYALNNDDCAPDDKAKWQSGLLYIDADGDGYDNGSATLCYGASVPAGHAATTNGTDCNDNNTAVNIATTWYRDADGDGFGNPSNSTRACTQPAGFVANNGDCNDNNAAVRPGAAEVCGNRVDDNCDGQIDEGCNNRVLITIADATVYEAAGTVRVTVSLTRASTQPVTVSFRTTDGTATSRTNRNTARDYTAISGTRTIPAGQRTAFIEVPVVADNVTEGPETFAINLSRPANAAIEDASATVTIYDGSAPVTTTMKIEKAVAEYRPEEALSVRATPNPAAHVFTVYTSSRSSQPLTLQVTDMLGHVVEARSGLAANSYVRIGQQYRPGIYVLTLMQGGRRVTTTLVKQIE